MPLSPTTRPPARPALLCMASQSASRRSRPPAGLRIGSPQCRAARWGRGGLPSGRPAPAAALLLGTGLRTRPRPTNWEQLRGSAVEKSAFAVDEGPKCSQDGRGGAGAGSGGFGERSQPAEPKKEAPAAGRPLDGGDRPRRRRPPSGQPPQTAGADRGGHRGRHGSQAIARPIHFLAMPACRMY